MEKGIAFKSLKKKLKVLIKFNKIYNSIMIRNQKLVVILYNLYHYFLHISF